MDKHGVCSKSKVIQKRQITHNFRKDKLMQNRKRRKEIYGTDLPIFKHRDEIIEKIKQDGKLIVWGQTGWGKTTQVPKYIFESDLNEGKVIAVTQPRRVAAVTIAQRVAKELGTKWGDKVGYSIRFEKRVSSTTKIEYLTDGMLLREAILDPQLSKFSTIVLDEVHERTVNTDVLMSIVKTLRNTTRPDLKIVVMSATIDIPKISEYFDIDSVVKVEGRTYPVEIYNIDKPEGNYIDNALIAILQVHLDQPEGDILCFWTGQEDIEDIQSLLEEKMNLEKTQNIIAPLTVVPLFANLPNHLQLKAFEKVDGRKVILATNIAETSVTINGIRYIIDTGLWKIKTYLATTGLETLKISAISKNSAIQRAGRAGREASGKWFRLYTEEIYNEMATTTVPEIFRTNLSRIIIQLKAIGVKDVSEFDFIDKPDKQLYIKAFKELSDLKCLDMNADLNELGRKMAVLPTEPIFSKLLIHSLKGEYSSICKDIAVIVAMLSVENIFFTPRTDQRKAERKHKKFIVSNSDHLTLLNVYNYYKNNRNNKEFWKENYINEKSIKKAIQIVDQLVGYLKTISQNDTSIEEEKDESKLNEIGPQLLELEHNTDRNDLILKCLYEGLPLNLAENHFGTVYRTCRSNEECYIHPTSVLFNSKNPCVFTEIVVTTKKYMRFVSDISSVYKKSST